MNDVVGSLKLSPKDLFSTMQSPEKDEKCVDISRLFQEVAIRHMKIKGPLDWVLWAEIFYFQFSLETKLTAPEIEEQAQHFYNCGAQPGTIKRFYSHVLKPGELENWQINSISPEESKGCCKVTAATVGFVAVSLGIIAKMNGYL